MSRGTEQRKTNRRGAGSSGKICSGKICPALGQVLSLGRAAKILCTKILQVKKIASISHNFSSHPLSQRNRFGVLQGPSLISLGSPKPYINLFCPPSTPWDMTAVGHNYQQRRLYEVPPVFCPMGMAWILGTCPTQYYPW